MDVAIALKNDEIKKMLLWFVDSSDEERLSLFEEESAISRVASVYFREPSQFQKNLAALSEPILDTYQERAPSFSDYIRQYLPLPESSRHRYGRYFQIFQMQIMLKRQWAKSYPNRGVRDGLSALRPGNPGSSRLWRELDALMERSPESLQNERLEQKLKRVQKERQDDREKIQSAEARAVAAEKKMASASIVAARTEKETALGNEKIKKLSKENEALKAEQQSMRGELSEMKALLQQFLAERSGAAAPQEELPGGGPRLFGPPN